MQRSIQTLTRTLTCVAVASAHTATPRLQPLSRAYSAGAGAGLSPSGNAALLHEFMQMHSLGIADVLKAAAILVDLG